MINIHRIKIESAIRETEYGYIIDSDDMLDVIHIQLGGWESEEDVPVDIHEYIQFVYKYSPEQLLKVIAQGEDVVVGTDEEHGRVYMTTTELQHIISDITQE